MGYSVAAVPVTLQFTSGVERVERQSPHQKVAPDRTQWGLDKQLRSELSSPEKRGVLMPPLGLGEQ